MDSLKIMSGLMQVAAVFSVFILVSILLAYPVKWTWNYCMPHIFGMPEISVLQAWCLQFLVSLFKIRSEVKK